MRVINSKLTPCKTVVVVLKRHSAVVNGIFLKIEGAQEP